MKEVHFDNSLPMYIKEAIHVHCSLPMYIKGLFYVHSFLPLYIKEAVHVHSYCKFRVNYICLSLISAYRLLSPQIA